MTMRSSETTEGIKQSSIKPPALPICSLCGAHRWSTVSSKQALSAFGRGQRRKVCRPPCWVLNQILMAITAGRVGRA